MYTSQSFSNTSTEALGGSSTAPSTETEGLPSIAPMNLGPKRMDTILPAEPGSASVSKPDKSAAPPYRVQEESSSGLECPKRRIHCPTLPMPPSRKPHYQPVVSSPLREVGEDGSSDLNPRDPPNRPVSRAQQRQQSLKICIVGAPSAFDRKVSDPTGGLRREASVPTESQTNALLVNQFATIRGPRFCIEPAAAPLNTVGQEFSRYPSRKPSMDSPGAVWDGFVTDSDIIYATPASPSVDERVFIPFGFGTRARDRRALPFSTEASDTATYPTWNEKEDDDDLHNPNKNEERQFNLCYWRSWNRWICLQLSSMTLVILGVLCAGVLYPILVSIQIFDKGGSMESLSSFDFGHLTNIRTSMIDPDTPEYAMARDSVFGRGKLNLVFSDEFAQDGRTFYPGEDQFWTAPRIHYGATDDLEMYDPDALITQDGTLQIQFQSYRDYDLDYRSGMLQSWNKLCFKGGVMEVSTSLAGPSGVAGLWPGIWSLGNLARPGYRASSDGIWPYSYDQCDVGITPNQSAADGISFLPGQRLAKCVCRGEDHPSPGVGRGAPEIDALEGTINYDLEIGEVTQSSQIAPFDIWYQSDYGYVAINNDTVTRMNGWQGGPFQQAISGVTTLNNDWYDGNQYQKYAFEYIPGKGDGAIAWFVGNEETFRMSGNAIGPNGNVGQRDVSQEPMSIILNLGMSKNWAWIDLERLSPRLAQGTVMRIDYVRIYQEEGKESITCDPPGYPTTQYIADHPRAYDNANLTQWDETGYPWPRNRFMDQCR